MADTNTGNDESNNGTENDDAQNPTPGAGEQGTGSSDFTPPATQDEFDRIIQKRIDRERAKFADYDDLKAERQSLSESVETLTGERDGLASEVTDLKTKVEGFESEKAHAALVNDVAEKSGVDASVLRGSNREELEAHAATLKDVFKPSAPFVKSQADTPGQSPADPSRKAVRGLFGSTD